MNEERRSMIESHLNMGMDELKKYKKKNKDDDNNKKFPKLTHEKPLFFPTFTEFIIEEAPDFNTSCEEDMEEEEKGKEGEEKWIYNNKNIIDRIRTREGNIDLGLNKTDFGRITGSDDLNHDKKRRRMINYDDFTKTREKTDQEKVMRDKEEEEKEEEKEESKFKIPFEFGDRGSTWRMIKLNKLSSINDKRPKNEKILEQYATLWDYELACLERDELERRKFVSRKEWIFKPSDSFINKRDKHIKYNNCAIKAINNKKAKVDMKKIDDEPSVIEIKKMGNVKMSKSQRLKNELKLVHLTNMDYLEDDDYITISREQIESLTNSP